MHAVVRKYIDSAPGILEGLTTIVLLLDNDLELVYLNPAGENLFEVSARQAVGHSLAELMFDGSRLLERLNQALETHHSYTEREVKVKITPERSVTLDCAITPMSGPNEIQGVLVEISPVDRHLRISRDEHLIAQHNAARKLVRGMAHEIKNPLGGLRGAAQLLEAELENEELKEYTGIIIGEADRLQNLVNRMLGPNSLPHQVEINIHQVLEHVRSLVLAEGHPGLAIERDYDPSIPELNADPELLIQAVLNIVRNAAQAGGDQITLRTRAQRQFTIGHTRHKLVIRVQIQDNGPGIPDDMMEQVFYPMVTGRADGTGLGLSIAQSLVNQHGGLIECSSRPGKTEFTILLPLESENE